MTYVSGIEAMEFRLPFQGRLLALWLQWTHLWVTHLHPCRDVQQTMSCALSIKNREARPTFKKVSDRLDSWKRLVPFRYSALRFTKRPRLVQNFSICRFLYWYATLVSFNDASQHVAEILVLELGLILHSSFITALFVGWTIFLVTAFVREEHVCWTGVSRRL